jgi:hypothetical protein
VCDPSLVATSQRLLNRARLISEQPAAQTSPIGRGHPTASPPPGAFSYQVSTLQQFGVRINQAIAHDSDIELAAANAWAQSELYRLQHGPKEVAETRKAFHLRIVRDYSGFTAPEVARQERSSVSEVRLARTSNGRTARFGYKPEK